MGNCKDKGEEGGMGGHRDKGYEKKGRVWEKIEEKV